MIENASILQVRECEKWTPGRHPLSLARSITSSARGIKQTAVGELQIRPAALLPK